MEITQITTNGYKMNIRVPVGFQDTKVIHEVIASDTYGFEELKHLNPSVVLDIGGHIGSFGVLARTHWPDCKLIAFEPCKVSAELYEKNLRDNGLYDVNKTIVLNKAVSYDKACNCLVNSPTSTGGHVLRKKVEAEQYVLEQYRWYSEIQDEVEVVTIEDVCDEFDIDVIDFAKWDCEGGEVDAFNNMSDECASKFRFMAGEYHLWDETTRYLKPSKFECIQFWRRVKKKFPNLYWNYKENALGLFQARPKDF
ncbi:MAG: FkbM family methyltransferase [Candidatus Peribacteraceae bacterium]|nr:FkbM family methyltransferase [Candidatus Peribacteraceae bacterium]